MARNFKPYRAFLSSLLLVLLIHTDARFLPFILVLPGLVLAMNRSWSATLKVWSWTLLFFVLLMVPYQIRGFVAFGKPVIVTERVLEKWLPLFGTRLASDRPAEGGSLRAVWLRDWESKKSLELDRLTPEERNYFLSGGRPAVGRVETYWYQFLEYWRFGRFEPTYRPYPDGRFTGTKSLPHFISSVVVVVPFLLLLPFAWKRSSQVEKRLLLVILLFLAAHTFLHVVTHARERYRIPVEVLTSIVVALSLVNVSGWIGDWYRRRRSRFE